MPIIAQTFDASVQTSVITVLPEPVLLPTTKSIGVSVYPSLATTST